MVYVSVVRLRLTPFFGFLNKKYGVNTDAWQMFEQNEI